MSTEHFKYVHILHRDPTLFYVPLVKSINLSGHFSPEEHLFVVSSADVYAELKQYGENVVLAEVKAKNPHLNTVQIINQYGSRCDWIFLHALFPQPYLLFVHKKVLPKIIWRTWGHDTGFFYNDGEKLQNFIKHCLTPFVRARIRKFKCIGVQTVVDEIVLAWTHCKFFRIPYIMNDYSTADLQAIKDANDKKENKTIRVLIGHSGTIMDNHEGILQSIEKWADRDLTVYIGFSYCGPGDVPRLKKMKEYVKQKWRDNVVFLEQMMPYEEYLKFLGQIDIVILDGLSSYALGNIGIALLFQKKIFLNRAGMLKKAFDHDSLPYCCTDEIEKMTYEDFIKPLVYHEENMQSSFVLQGAETYFNDWKQVLDWLDKEQG